MIRKVGDFEVREEWVEDYSSYMFVVYDRGMFHFQTYYLVEAMNYVRKMTLDRSSNNFRRHEYYA